MTKLKPWYTLDIDVNNAIRNDFDFAKLLENSEFKNAPAGIFAIVHKDLKTLFTDTWLEYMKQQQLDVGSCLMFYRKPFYIHPETHIDIIKSTGALATYALNWILDPEDDSEMIWYDFPNDTGSSENTPVNTPYVSWPNSVFDNQTPVARCIKNQLTLVRTGLPHNVIMREKARWSISIRFPVATNNITNWEEAVDFFKPWILE
jgi:hypothetical protein